MKKIPKLKCFKFRFKCRQACDHALSLYLEPKKQRSKKINKQNNAWSQVTLNAATFSALILSYRSLTVFHNCGGERHPPYISLDFKARVYYREWCDDLRAIDGRYSLTHWHKGCKIIRLTFPKPSLSVKYNGKYA